MKLKYILAAGVVALLAGCDESRFLDTKPQGTLNDDLLSSAEGVELLVTSAYAGLKGPNRDMHWVPMTNWTYGEVRSDNAYKGGGGVNDGDFCTLLETFKIDATWANADEKWFQLYCCLQRCNSALRVMNTLDENTLPVLKSRKAEMKVIRAHFSSNWSAFSNKYLTLTKTWILMIINTSPTISLPAKNFLARLRRSFLTPLTTCLTLNPK